MMWTAAATHGNVLAHGRSRRNFAHNHNRNRPCPTSRSSRRTSARRAPTRRPTDQRLSLTIARHSNFLRRANSDSTPRPQSSPAAESSVSRQPSQFTRRSQPAHLSARRPAALKRAAKLSIKPKAAKPKPVPKPTKKRASRLERKKLAAAEEHAILSALRLTICGAIQTAASQLQLVHAVLSGDATPAAAAASAAPAPALVAAPQPAVQRYDVRSMMLMAASAHSAMSLFSTRELLETSDLPMLLNEQDQAMHEEYVDEWCDYAMLEEEERMNSSLPQKFRSASPPRRYSKSCVEVKMGKISAGAAFEHKGTPARATFRPIRKTPPSWASKHRH